MSTRKNKSCSFDLADPYQAELLKFVEEKRHGNYSVFVKQLIAERMEKERRVIAQSAPVSISNPVVNEVVTDGFL